MAWPLRVRPSSALIRLRRKVTTDIEFSCAGKYA
jgi:hypothetical protein